MKVWPSASYSDFPADQTFHKFHDLNTDFDLDRIMSGHHGVFAMGFVRFWICFLSVCGVLPNLPSTFIDSSTSIYLVNFRFCLAYIFSLHWFWMPDGSLCDTVHVHPGAMSVIMYNTVNLFIFAGGKFAKMLAIPFSWYYSYFLMRVIWILFSRRDVFHEKVNIVLEYTLYLRIYPVE